MTLKSGAEGDHPVWCPVCDSADLRRTSVDPGGTFVIAQCEACGLEMEVHG